MAKILSLHTESEILGLLQIVFRRAGYEHLFTTNSRTALDILQKETIDLFIQNLMRSDINGCEFYAIMQEDKRLRRIPVLTISALDPIVCPEVCRHVIQDLYPNRYLLMPFSPQKLLSTTSKILSEASISTVAHAHAPISL